MTDIKDTILKGYFLLSGSPDPSLLDDSWITGNHLRSQNRGAFGIHTDWTTSILNIPARDKQVTLWAASDEIEEFAIKMEFIDSSDGHNYKSKLLAMQDTLHFNFRGMVNNVNVSTHGSLALIGDFNYVGVVDQHTQSVYIAWSDTPFQATGYFGSDCDDANRYLVYRLPKMPVVFLPSENICAKWYKWQGSRNMLLAFNALERRLNR